MGSELGPLRREGMAHYRAVLTGAIIKCGCGPREERMKNPREAQEWAEVLEQTAQDLRQQSETLVKQARDLRAESNRLRKVARKARNSPLQKRNL